MADRTPVSERGKRLWLFRNHLIVYFATIVVLVLINFATTPEFPWFIWPMIGWMAPVAIHAAYAMGLFDRPRE